MSTIVERSGRPPPEAVDDIVSMLTRDYGERASVNRAIREQHGFSFVLAHDAEQRIARLYGVRCWPTTISVNPDGLIDHVQFGIAHQHASRPNGDKAGAY